MSNSMDPNEARRLLSESERLLPDISTPPLPGNLRTGGGSTRRWVAVSSGVLVTAAVASVAVWVGTVGTNSSPRVSSAAGTDLPSPTVALSVSATPPPSSTATAEASGSPSPSIANCSANDLSAELGSISGFSFHTIDTIKLMNTSSMPCQLEGYPKIEAYTQSGTSIPITVVNSTSTVLGDVGPVESVTIAPEHEVGFYIGSVRDPNGACAPIIGAGVRIIPPGSDVPLPQLEIQVGLCSGLTVYVSPIVDKTTLPGD